jgi:hypothetical protein
LACHEIHCCFQQTVKIKFLPKQGADKNGPKYFPKQGDVKNGSKRDETKGTWGKLRTEKIHNVCFHQSSLGLSFQGG